MGTYQTRVSVYAGRDRAGGDAALAACGELYGRVQRKLFAAFAAGRSVASLKGEYLREYGIPARMFNGVRVSVEGKIASVREGMKLRLDDLERRIARAERQVSKAVRKGRRQQAHQKRRRLANLRCRLTGLEADIAEGRVRLCFGSKRLWRQQRRLGANGGTPATRSGWGTGVAPGAASSSCWEAGTRPVVVSSVLPVLPTTAR